MNTFRNSRLLIIVTKPKDNTVFQGTAISLRTTVNIPAYDHTCKRFVSGLTMKMTATLMVMEV